MASFNELFIEGNLPISAIVPANYSGSAQTGVWAWLNLYQSVFVLIQTGAWAGGTAAVTLSQAVDLSGTSSKSLAYSIDGYSPSATATQANLWTNTTTTGTWTVAAIASNTFNLSAPNTLYMFEVFARDLDVNNNFQSFRVNVASPGSNADLYGVSYIFRQPGYAQSGTAMITPLGA